MDNQRAAAKTPSDFWEAVFRHKKKILLTPTAILLTAVAVILFAPRTYLSEAKLLLQVGRESVGVDPTATTGQMISLQQMGRDAEVISAKELIGSRQVLREVVKVLGPEYIMRGGPEDPSKEPNALVKSLLSLAAPLEIVVDAVRSIDEITDEERAVIRLEKSLGVKTQRNSTVLVLYLESKSPDGAQTILDTLVEVYKQEHLRVHRNPESQTFFAEQHSLLKKRLETASMKVRDAKVRMGITSVAGRRETLENQLAAVEKQTYRAEQNLATALARVTDLRGQLRETPERMVAMRRSVPNEGLDLLRDQLFELERQKAELAARLTDTHPQMRAISAQVAEAEKVVSDQSKQREETTNDINPIHQELSLELNQQAAALAGYEGQLKVQRDQKQLILRDLKQLNRDEVELDELEREVELARSKFFKYSDNLEQARIDQELEDQRVSSVSVAQNATLSEKPVSPSKLLVGLGSLLLAFAGTTTWVISSEQLNDKIRTGEAAEAALGLPYFAEIPKSNLHGRVLNY